MADEESGVNAFETEIRRARAVTLKLYQDNSSPESAALLVAFEQAVREARSAQGEKQEAGEDDASERALAFEKEWAEVVRLRAAASGH